MYLSLLVGFSALMFCCDLANASAKVDETPPHNPFDHSPPQPLQRKIPQGSAGAVISEDVDSILDAAVRSALHELQRQYPLDPEEDLGGDLKTYLKGVEGWDDYLTPDVEKYIDYAVMYEKSYIGAIENVAKTIGWRIDDSGSLEDLFG